MNVYSIRDIKSEAYNRPFFSQTRATAMREISVGIPNDETMRSFAADFALFEIGTFDTTTGRITGQEPYHVVDVIELLAKPEE